MDVPLTSGLCEAAVEDFGKKEIKKESLFSKNLKEEFLNG